MGYIRGDSAFSSIKPLIYIIALKAEQNFILNGNVQFAFA